MAPRHLAVLIATMVSLAAPAAAEAGTLTREGTVIVFSTAPGDDAVNDIVVVSNSGSEPYSIGDNAGPLTISAADCADGGPGFAECTNVTAFRIETGGGNDGVNAQGRPTPRRCR